MNKLPLYVLVLIMYSSIAYTQSVKKQKQIKVYRIWLKGEVDIKGIFYEATDSSVIIIPNNDDWQHIDKASLIEIQAKEIYKIKLRRLKGINRGAATGAFIGAVPVGVAGVLFLSAVAKGFGDDLEPGAGVAIILMGGAAGTGIGAAIGSFKTKYKIDYSHTKYKVIRPELQQKSLKTQLF